MPTPLILSVSPQFLLSTEASTLTLNVNLCQAFSGLTIESQQVICLNSTTAQITIPANNYWITEPTLKMLQLDGHNLTFVSDVAIEIYPKLYHNAQLITPIIDGSKSTDIVILFDWVSPYALNLQLGGSHLKTTLVGQQIFASVGAGFPTGTFILQLLD